MRSGGVSQKLKWCEPEEVQPGDILFLTLIEVETLVKAMCTGTATQFSNMKGGRSGDGHAESGDESGDDTGDLIAASGFTSGSCLYQTWFRTNQSWSQVQQSSIRTVTLHVSQWMLQMEATWC